MKTLPRIIAGNLIYMLSYASMVLTFFSPNRMVAIFSYGVAFILQFFSCFLFNNPTKRITEEIKRMQGWLLICVIATFIFSLVLFVYSSVSVVAVYINIFIIATMVIFLLVISFLLLPKFKECTQIEENELDIQLRLNANIKALLSSILIIFLYVDIMVLGLSVYLLFLLPIFGLAGFLGYQRLVFCKMFLQKEIIKRFLFENSFVIVAIALCMLFTDSNLLSGEEEISVGFNIIIFIITNLLLIPTFLTNSKFMKRNREYVTQRRG